MNVRPHIHNSTPKEQEKPAGIHLLQVVLEAGVDPNVPTSSSGEV
jgi:hypothetical protein